MKNAQSKLERCFNFCLAGDTDRVQEYIFVG